MSRTVMFALICVTACNRSHQDTAHTDPPADSGVDTDPEPYECSDFEAQADKAEPCHAWVEFVCTWNKCADPELDVEQCIEDVNASTCTNLDNDDKSGWCAVEECLASVPAETECPPDATTNPYWYMADPSCRYVTNPEQ